ncbi:hypothetical protein [Virgisporangium ochraceum]|uniref:Uncharacterized protein n=1 Tax=Virgisporangium ochraceum TaxID=65505 RepID=A0A8J4EDF8_9ACTN|nr:hypothetical protein [Virgisporangium ochraceum]GIJ67902.1 hypothetical protein Voc01_028190 [Virgisporangium ochraceum]
MPPDRTRYPGRRHAGEAPPRPGEQHSQATGVRRAGVRRTGGLRTEGLRTDGLRAGGRNRFAQCQCLAEVGQPAPAPEAQRERPGQGRHGRGPRRVGGRQHVDGGAAGPDCLVEVGRVTAPAVVALQQRGEDGEPPPPPHRVGTGRRDGAAHHSRRIGSGRWRADHQLVDHPATVSTRANP